MEGAGGEKARDEGRGGKEVGKDVAAPAFQIPHEDRFSQQSRVFNNFQPLKKKKN